jgi:hypothetical protein
MMMHSLAFSSNEDSNDDDAFSFIHDDACSSIQWARCVPCGVLSSPVCHKSANPPAAVYAGDTYEGDPQWYLSR